MLAEIPFENVTYCRSLIWYGFWLEGNANLVWNPQETARILDEPGRYERCITKPSAKLAELMKIESARVC